MFLKVVIANKEVICVGCGNSINKGNLQMWNPNHGYFHPECFMTSIQDKQLKTRVTGLGVEEKRTRRQCLVRWAMAKSRLKQYAGEEEAAKDDYTREVSKLRMVRERWTMLGIYKIIEGLGGAPPGWVDIVDVLMQEVDNDVSNRLSNVS